MMKHIFSFSLITFSLLFSSALFSCKKENAQVQELPTKTESEFKWYYFTPSGFVKTEFPDKSTVSLFKPWTEAVRVSDANSDSEDGALMLVNRLGVLVFSENETPSFMQDVRLFGTATASNLVFVDKEPVFTLYRSAFFNKNVAKKSDDLSPAEVVKSPLAPDVNRPYIARVARENSMFYPVLTYADMGIPESEVTGTHFDGENWISSVKTVTDERILFRYLKWKSVGSLLNVSSSSAKINIIISDTEKDEYRDTCSPSSFSSAPQRLKNLLKIIPTSVTYSIICKTAGGHSPRNYMHGTGDEILESSAIIAPAWICAIFADGTTYFAGALNNRFIINDGEPFAFRLPKLPAGFRYTDFCISGDFLAVGWEENNFYKTGRSGFTVIDLSKILYETKGVAK